MRKHMQPHALEKLLSRGSLQEQRSPECCDKKIWALFVSGYWPPVCVKKCRALFPEHMLLPNQNCHSATLNFIDATLYFYCRCAESLATATLHLHYCHEEPTATLDAWSLPPTPPGPARIYISIEYCQSDLYRMDVVFRKLLRMVVGAPGNLDWSRPWHEILHERNMKVQTRVREHQMKLWSHRCLKSYWKLGLYIANLPAER